MSMPVVARLRTTILPLNAGPKLGAKTLIPPPMLLEGDEMAVMLDPQGMSFALWRRG